MSIRGFAALSAACLVAVSGAQAVTLAARGEGQVLIYPYYEARPDHVTALTLVNESDRGKALRFAVREGLDGREALSFNLYLGAHDTWTASFFALSEDGAGALLTDDASCTYPAIRTNSSLPTLADGRHYVSFRNVAFSGDNQDAGPSDASRTQHGFVEVIEMGSVQPGSELAKALAPNDAGTPANCGFLDLSFAGIWSTDANAYLANPTGQLRGNAQLVDVEAGRLYGYDAAAIDDFRTDPSDAPRGSKTTVVMHTKPDATPQHPNLADALTDPGRKIAAADVPVARGLLHLEYPQDRAVDAVSAVLMSSSLSNDAQFDLSIGASTEWILAMPTAGFYRDQAIVGTTPLPPFPGVFPKMGDGDQASIAIVHTEYDRAGQVGFPTQLLLRGVAMRFVVLMSPNLAGAPATVGWWSDDLTRPASSAKVLAMRAANDGTVLLGLPAALGVGWINFSAITSAGQPANYSSRSDHRSTLRCQGGTSGLCE